MIALVIDLFVQISAVLSVQPVSSQLLGGKYGFIKKKKNKIIF